MFLSFTTMPEKSAMANIGEKPDQPILGANKSLHAVAIIIKNKVNNNCFVLGFIKFILAKIRMNWPKNVVKYKLHKFVIYAKK